MIWGPSADRDLISLFGLMAREDDLVNVACPSRLLPDCWTSGLQPSGAFPVRTGYLGRNALPPRQPNWASVIERRLAVAIARGYSGICPFTKLPPDLALAFARCGSTPCAVSRHSVG